MLTEYACTRWELSCILGNLFAEISPPCDRCGKSDDLVICGITHHGNPGVLTVTKDGFQFDGNVSEIEEIRERRCLVGTIEKESV